MQLQSSKAAKKPQKRQKEPLFHIVKRDAMPRKTAILVRVAAVALGVLFCALLVLLLGGVNPLQYFQSMIKGNFGTAKQQYQQCTE